MTREFQRLTELLRFGMFGTKPEVNTEAQLDVVCEIARRQGVLPIVFGALDKDTKRSLDPKWQQMFLGAIMKNEQKMLALGGIIKELDREGIPYCVLKGCTVAKEYYLSDCRVSGDIDLYVKPEFEKKTAELFRKLGFEVGSRIIGKQDFEVTSPATGLIEVHVQLYHENFNRIVLQNRFEIRENFREMIINDYISVKALGINDTLYFLTNHFLKHFLREGSGIRQITDLLVFVNNHKDEIDFNDFFSRMEELRFKRLILNVFGIGVKFFGLDFGEYALDMIDEIMDDVEAGENFGYGEIERAEFYEQFMKRRASRENGDFRWIAKRKKKAIFKSIFLPTRKQLADKGYLYAQKSALLYPVAYIHRIWDIFISLLRRKKTLQTAMDYAYKENVIVNSRLKMMKKLDIIE